MNEFLVLLIFIFILFLIEKIDFDTRHEKYRCVYIQQVGDYYVDTNGNKWSCDKYFKNDVAILSSKLKNCYNCVDCYNCVNCNSCINCIKCLDCVNCENCFNCKKCYNILDRKNVINVSDYENKYYCNLLDFLKERNIIFNFLRAKNFIEEWEYNNTPELKEEYNKLEDMYYTIIYEFKEYFDFKISNEELEQEIFFVQKRYDILNKINKEICEYDYFQTRILDIFKDVILNSEKRYLKFSQELEKDTLLNIFLKNIGNIDDLRINVTFCSYNIEKYILENIRKNKLYSN